MTTSPVLLLCGTDDVSIIHGLYKVTRWCATAGLSVRWCVSDDADEVREALLAPVRWIIWDTHGGGGPTIGGHRLDDLLGGGSRRITAEVFMLGCCWGGTAEFTDVISRYLARPTAFLGCQNTPHATHGRLLFPPLLEALRPHIGTGALPDALAKTMNTALDRTRAAHPQLTSAVWKARVLSPCT